jgi:redox-sensitive bicupin YhaK (pirin superfamily)
MVIFYSNEKKFPIAWLYYDPPKFVMKVRNFDPFLLFDEFTGKEPAGFPDHPHRGFETVTYMISGQFCHEDFAGHKGIIIFQR